MADYTGWRSLPELGDEYDVCVIGGGVNGLAIARDATLRGLRVVLLERRDISSGTSAWSTRLIHGGLKYLEHLDVRLVLESIRERAELLRNAPHLVRPYPMLIPFYRGARRSRHLIRLGLYLHSLLAVRGGLPRSRSVPRAELERRWPGLSRQGLRGAALYHDAQVPWAERLCVEMAIDAIAHGAQLATYTTVTGLRPARRAGDPVEVIATDASGHEARVRARVVVNATGPWVDQVLAGASGQERLIGGTKGSHVVVDPFPGAPPTCVFFEAASDGRPMFVLPWAGRYLLGTTDITADGDLDELTASDPEIEYLTSEVRRLFPASGIAPDRVLYSYAGVRPLPYTPSVKDNAKISRDHTIVRHDGELAGVLTVVGGKLTTHRALGEDAVDVAVSVLGGAPHGCRTRGRPFPGAVGFDREALRQQLVDSGVFDARQAERQLDLYGSRAVIVAGLASDEPELRAVIDEETGAIGAEVAMAVRYEGARTVTDTVFRRTMVGYTADVGRSSAAAVTEIMARELKWSDGRAADEMTAFERERKRYRPRT